MPLIDLTAIAKDKNLYADERLPLITVYDDNFFVRNDYDVLSFGQRQYVVNYFKGLGFEQKTGKTLVKGGVTIHLPSPNSNLALSSFNTAFITQDLTNYYCVTPTGFAETLFYFLKDKPSFEVVKELRKLIKKCPYNIEWLRDVSYRSAIEQVTIETFQDLMAFQDFIVKKRFKNKKAL